MTDRDAWVPSDDDVRRAREAAVHAAWGGALLTLLDVRAFVCFRAALVDGAGPEVERLTRERDEARANYQFMVERAADEKLDGYRELGARAAQAENERDTAQSALAAARGEVERLRAGLHKALGIVEGERATDEQLIQFAAGAFIDQGRLNDIRLGDAEDAQ